MKDEVTHVVVDMRRKKSNGYVIAMFVYGMASKADAHERAAHIRKSSIKKRGEIRYVHVRRIVL